MSDSEPRARCKDLVRSSWRTDQPRTVRLGQRIYALGADPLGSLPLAMVYHWVRYFLINLVFLVMVAMGLG